jgi:hypothetical protein
VIPLSVNSAAAMAVKPSRTRAALMAATWSGIIAAAAGCACHKYG